MENAIKTLGGSPDATPVEFPAEHPEVKLNDPAWRHAWLAYAPPGAGLLQDYQDRAKQLQDRVDLYQWLAEAEGKNKNPDPGTSAASLIELMVGLDLSFSSYRAGPVMFGRFAHSSTIADIQHYSEWFTAAERAYQNRTGDDWYREVAGNIDLSPLGNALSPTSWMPGSMSIPSEMGQAWGVPSLSFVSLDDLRQFRDTPADTPDKIPQPFPITTQLQAVEKLLLRAWADPAFHSNGDHKVNHVTITGQVVSPSPGQPVPDLPRGGFLATYFNVSRDDLRIPVLRNEAYCIGTRRNEIRACDADGNYRFEAMWRLVDDQQEMGVNAFSVQPGTGAINATTDLGTQAGEIQIYAKYRGQDPDPLRSLVFNCQEFSLTGLYDPRFLQDLNDVVLLDARRNAEPQKYNILVKNQMMAGFVEPGTPLYLLLRYGRVGNRLILVDMPLPDADTVGSATSSDQLGRGYNPDRLNNLGLLSLATSRDFWRLDDLRLAKYAKAGVSSDLIDTLHKQAGEQIKLATEMAADPKADGQAVVTNANGAWANEARVYNAAQDMANDVVHAAIFLLLLLVPFSFCMERLLIGTANVYKQIGGIAVIFTVMTGALWSFHPAFKISSSPLIIILAFAIIFMSVVVIAVVYGKFDSELKRIRSGRGGDGNCQHRPGQRNGQRGRAGDREHAQTQVPHGPHQHHRGADYLCGAVLHQRQPVPRHQHAGPRAWPANTAA